MTPHPRVQGRPKKPSLNRVKCNCSNPGVHQTDAIVGRLGSSTLTCAAARMAMTHVSTSQSMRQSMKPSMTVMIRKLDVRYMYSSTLFVN